jgi:hypothetical protein
MPEGEGGGPAVVETRGSGGGATSRETWLVDLCALARRVYQSPNLRWKGVGKNKDYKRVPKVNVQERKNI